MTTQPLVNLRPYQKVAFWRNDLRLQAWMWSRQKGKSTTMAAKQLHAMMTNPGLLCIYASASLNMGREIIEKNASVFYKALDGLRTLCAAQGHRRLETSVDGGTFDDFKDVFERQALEVKIWHDNTTCSRTKVIAPNPATARGWSGWVFLDEFGWVPDFRGVWDGVEPIMSSDPTFRMLMATTPPEDDAHFSYELLLPEQQTFPVNPEGNWYKSKAGIWVHRVDAWDAHAANVPLYDQETGKPLTPDEHRAQALDKQSWDRNYGLKFISGGTSAMSLVALATAQARGAGCLACQEEDLPPGWEHTFGTGKIGIGYDTATTEKEKSNPSSIVVTEQVGNIMTARLVWRWKTANPAVAIERTENVVRRLIAAGKRPRRLCIDGSNERYFATTVATRLRALIQVEVVVGSETVEHKGEKLSMKDYLGNLAANTIEDGNAALPPDKWVETDFRLVKKKKGHFDNDLDSSGNHGDTFDGFKLSLKGLVGQGSGPAVASAISPGGSLGAAVAGAARAITNLFN